MKTDTIIITICIIVSCFAFGLIIWDVGTTTNQRSEYLRKVDECVIENKGLPDVKNYCRSLVRWLDK